MNKLLSKKTIHLIGNAHLDPVWLWDRYEGLNEGITTVSTILDLMDEFEEMTFIRGESAIYQHIERFAPPTFRRIEKMVALGRWDVVGGSYIQPDTNLSGTETLIRHFTHGLRYFQSRFGKTVTAAWQADSFGHTAGLPEVLAAAGITSFAFSRPQQQIIPFAQPSFWWEGDGDAKILCYRSVNGAYQNERYDMMKCLDETLESAFKGPLQNIACFYGLGNHGGGPSRRHIREIRSWANRHPEVEVVHSGLHRLAEALRSEVFSQKESLLPTHRGEINYCLRGCYSSVAKFKFPYRRSEALLCRAEKTDCIVAAALSRKASDLSATWDEMLFNSFHDILPGSSIERAMDAQISSLGSVLHHAAETEFFALNALGREVDTSLTRTPPSDQPSSVAAIVWNPHPFEFSGHIELEAPLDYRPLMEKYVGRDSEVPVEVLGQDRQPISFQCIRTEHSSLQEFPWRKRLVLPVVLPAFGWNVLEMGYVEDSKKLGVDDSVKSEPGMIANALWRVEANEGSAGVQIYRHGKEFFANSGLQAVLFDDPWGAWGGMKEEPDSIVLKDVRERWIISKVELLEEGPERAALWVRFSGKRSRIDLTFYVSRDRDAVDVSARVLFDDRSARLKLIFPVGDRVDYEVPGSVVRRGPAGEVPGARWARVEGRSSMGFVSDALYNFDSEQGEFRATVVRATRYANDSKTDKEAELWRPAVDCGELKFQFLITDSRADLQRMAEQLEQPPVVLLVPPSKGALKRKGSFLAVEPVSLRLLALKRAEDGDGFIFRVQADIGEVVQVKLSFLEQKLSLGLLKGGEIGTWKLHQVASAWAAIRCAANEYID